MALPIILPQDRCLIPQIIYLINIKAMLWLKNKTLIIVLVFTIRILFFLYKIKSRIRGKKTIFIIDHIFMD